MVNVRLHFSKTFDAKYISHLDLSRCFSRALKMSGLPVWYTEGFNPHLFLTFALPLSLGFESICEIVDIRLHGEEVDPYIKEKINAGLPHGIEVFNATPAARKPSGIAWARYIIELEDDVYTPEALCDATIKLLDQDSIRIQKKTKKGQIAEKDIKPLIHSCDIKARGGTCYIDIIAAAGNERSLNAGVLTELLEKELEKQLCHILIKRVQVLDANLENFE